MKDTFKLTEVYVEPGEKLLCIHSPRDLIRAGVVYTYGVELHKHTLGLFRRVEEHDL